MKTGPWAFEPYGFKWDGIHEYFSFVVPELAEQTVHERIGDKAKLKDFVSTFLGRGWDRERLVGIALRVVGAEKRIEVRVQYRAPWYITEGTLPDGRRRGRPEQTDAGTAEQSAARPVQGEASPQQRVAEILESSIGGVQSPGRGGTEPKRTHSEGGT